jgi:hypothetical protein
MLVDRTPQCDEPRVEPGRKLAIDGSGESHVRPFVIGGRGCRVMR